MSDYMDEVVSRCAPRWAWEMIDNLLAAQINSPIRNARYASELKLAAKAMMVACNNPVIDELSREDAEKEVV